MKHGLTNLREKIHKRFLDIKRVDCLLASERFDRICDCLTDDDIKTLMDHENKGELDEVQLILKKCLRRELETMSARQLKQLGKHYRIPYYYVMPRVRLIQEIQNAKERYSDNSTRKCD